MVQRPIVVDNFAIPSDWYSGYDGREVVDDVPAGEGEDAGLEPLVVQQQLRQGLVGIAAAPGQGVGQLRELASVVQAQGLVPEQWLGAYCMQCLQGT